MVVTRSPTFTAAVVIENEALPEPLVVTVLSKPVLDAPSPCVPSQDELRKASTLKLVLGVLLSVP